MLELLARKSLPTAHRRASCCRLTCATPAETLERVLDWCSEYHKRPPLVVRLVKGAYWDHEIVEARRHGWPAPVFEDKADCDRNFERLSPGACSTRDRSSAWPSHRTTSARSPMRSRTTALPAGPTATSSSRCFEARATTCSTRCSRHASAHLLSGGRPGRGDGVPDPAPAREHQQRVVPCRSPPRCRRRGAAGRAVKQFTNEPHAELRRAPVREQLLDALGALDPLCLAACRSG